MGADGVEEVWDLVEDIDYQLTMAVKKENFGISNSLLILQSLLELSFHPTLRLFVVFALKIMFFYCSKFFKQLISQAY
jgi:hypothetical protein